MPKFGTVKWHNDVLCTKNVRTDTLLHLGDAVRIPPLGFEFITQTLSPKLYSLSANKQFSRTVNDIISLLDYMCKDYCLVTELTQDGNVHYHAWILFKDNFKQAYYKDAIKSNFKFGYVMFSKKNFNKTTLQQQQDSYNYLKKDLVETYKFIRSKNIVLNPYDHGLDVDVQISEDYENSIRALDN